MNKKGFTLIELIAVIVILSILLVIGTYSISRYLIQGRDKAFNLLINSFEDSVLDAYTSCLANSSSSSFCTNHEMLDYNESKTIYLYELLDNGFIDKVENPWNTSESCNSNSYTIVTRDDKNNISFSYKTCLICGTHYSNGCN